MISSKRFKCTVCCYETDRKYNLYLHTSSPNACDKRLQRTNHTVDGSNVNVGVNNEKNSVNVAVNNESNVNVGINNEKNSVEGSSVNIINKCIKCLKVLSCKKSLDTHMTICKGVSSLQCFTCKKVFSTRQGKHQHLKNVKCEIIEDEKDKEIKILKQQLEEERSKVKVQNITINNNTNNYVYFNNNIEYNDYDNLSIDHITPDKINEMYLKYGKRFEEVAEVFIREIFSIPENQSYHLTEGPKSSVVSVIKDKKEILKTSRVSYIKFLAQVGKHLHAIAKVEAGNDASDEFCYRCVGAANMGNATLLDRQEIELFPIVKNALMEYQMKRNI